MNGFCVEMSAWCFDRKWWLHAYVGMTTFDLYTYMYLNEVNFQVCSREICFPYLPFMLPWIDSPQGHPFGIVPLHSRARVSSLKGLPPW
jgi:hypothetical protein